MAQHDYNIANQSGAAFRADLNNALSAIVTHNSGGSAPSPTFAYMVWADTTTGLRKMRNGANTAWINIGDLNGNVLVLDNNRNVGVGTSTPGSYNASYDNLVVSQSSGNGGITIATGPSAVGGIAFAEGTSGTAAYAGYISYDHSINRMIFGAEGIARMYLGGGGRFTVQTSGTVAHILGTSQGASGSIALIEGVYSGVQGETDTGTTSFRVYTNGNVQNSNNSYGGLSDVKLKENIVDANSQWDDIKTLRVRNYNFKEGQTHTQIGLVAQEVELVSPGLVSEASDRDEAGNDLGTTTKAVNYSVLYMKAVKALQEAMERIETLEAKVAALEAAP